MKQILLMLIAVVMVGCGKKEAGKPQAQPAVKAPSTSAPKEPTLQTKPTELTGAEKEFAETKAKAEAGEVWAQDYLAWMYGVGKGVEQDGKEATKWTQKAADQGHAYAQYNLGVTYQNGGGVPIDRGAAYLWYSIAAANGDTDAATAKADMAKEMIPSQIAKAQELVKEMVKKNPKLINK